MIALLHYAIPAFIFAMVLIATRYLFEDGRTGEASSLLKQILPALAAAVLGWFTLPFVQRLLAVRFLAGGPKENALAESAGWTLLYYFLAMVLGMVAQTIWHAIQNRQAGQPPTFDRWEFVKPGLVAPITFLAVYQSVSEPTVTVVMLIFSFQNGFFWQTVLRTAGR